MKTLMPRLALLSLLLIALLTGRGSAVGPDRVVAQTPFATPPPPGGPLRLNLYAGWNLIAVTAQGGAVTPARFPLYTLAPDGASYDTVPATEARPGVGYWAFFATANEGYLYIGLQCELCPPALPPIPLPAGQWVMIGNPYPQTVPIITRGADVVETYDPVIGEYEQTAELFIGQRAFAYSANGGVLTFDVKH